MVRKSDAVSVFDRLGLCELELLLDVVQGAGQQVSGCVPAPVDPPDDVLSTRCGRLPPHLLCWLLYRWTPRDCSEECRDVDLSELKKMPGCAGETESNVCCNPYHWSRISAATVTDTTRRRRARDGSASCSTVADDQQLKSGVFSSGWRGASNSTSSSDDDVDCRSWCTVAYWELRQRVGPLYAVRQPHVDVFSELVLGSGLCLSQLQSAAAVDASVLRARRKIGAGLVLSREPDSGVWVYNRSRYPIFVGRCRSAGVSTVDRVPPGSCLRVTDPDDEDWPVDGPSCGLRSVQVSFGKGFGTEGYSRRTIHACPCWLEILLRVT